MTTAARPTWLPALGGNRVSDNKSVKMHLKRAREVNAHLTLKFRADQAEGEAAAPPLPLDKAARKAALKRRLEEAEAAHFAAKRGGGATTGTAERQLAIAAAAPAHMNASTAAGSEGPQGTASSEVDTDSSVSSSSSEEEGEEGDDDEEEEDDTAQLMRELEKIKQERAAEKLRAEEREEAELQRQREEAALTGNPLLAEAAGLGGGGSGPGSFVVKRRWDEDVIFKNQAKAGPCEPKKRFINDMLRSDFHRKFMSKYMH